MVAGERAHQLHPLDQGRIDVRGSEERVPVTGAGPQEAQAVPHVGDHPVDVDDGQRSVRRRLRRGGGLKRATRHAVNFSHAVETSHAFHTGHAIHVARTAAATNAGRGPGARQPVRFGLRPRVQAGHAPRIRHLCASRTASTSMLLRRAIEHARHSG
ncbi:hypothetical protein FRAHR75_520018 [Frankia sp. Hr75.2]|nr:hypothetical protein FRAHR75_520018 [Frankia sp. Hr75.2]SQD98273.1 hypothetical protein FMEAI12_4580051 [Parafrankia sp. Ea1.12]